jgi:RIO kinase 1
MRNLKRLKQCGINAPTPLALRKHVLVMSFLGKDGWPAPQLAQAKLDDTKLRVIYLQVVMMMRRVSLCNNFLRGSINFLFVNDSQTRINFQFYSDVPNVRVGPRRS